HLHVVAPDLGHERRPTPLDRIATGPIAPLAAGQIPLDHPLAERPKLHHRAGRGRARTSLLDQTDPADHRVPPPRERLERGPRGGAVRRLSVDPRPYANHRVDPEDRGVAAGRGRRDGLAIGVLDRYLLGRTMLQLLD